MSVLERKKKQKEPEIIDNPPEGVKPAEEPVSARENEGDLNSARNALVQAVQEQKREEEVSQRVIQRKMTLRL